MKRKIFFIKTFCLAVTLSTGLFSQPLFTDATKTYEYSGETFKMGLYDGTNQMPAEHLAKGLAIAEEMRKMTKINITDVGHSVPNTTFSGWNWGSSVSELNLAANTNFKSASVPAKMAWDWVNQFKNGSSGGLAGFGTSDIHVLVVQLTWAPFMGPDNYEKNTKLSVKIDSMSHDLERLAKGAKQSFPNLKMILMQADPWQNNHEPYHAYHEWFFARQVVMDQINKANDYIGPSVDDVWIGLGGYWWMTNASGSYYSDCCHITGAGATYYRKAWLQALLKDNPVVAHWLSKDPPAVMVDHSRKAYSRVNNLHAVVRATGVDAVFSFAGAGRISMGLYSINGRAVVPMTEKNCTAGLNSVALSNGNPLVPGTYIIRMNDAKGLFSQHLMTVSR